MTTTERDFSGELRALIDEATSHGAYVPRKLATEIVEKLRANDEALLAGWLDAQAEHFVWQMINDRDRSRRSHAAATGGRSAFRDAAQEFDAARGSGPAAQETSTKRLRDFLGMRFTVEDGTRRELATLKAADLVFVSNDYERREQDNAFWKSFMRGLAKKVGGGTVGEHYTNEQLTTMFGSLG